MAGRIGPGNERRPQALAAIRQSPRRQADIERSCAAACCSSPATSPS